jgi:hypothetical protein
MQTSWSYQDKEKYIENEQDYLAWWHTTVILALRRIMSSRQAWIT